MDGRDDKNQNANPNENSTQQGIFSTPELTVDMDKIAQDDEAAAAASRAKIASIFANTETGQQAQRLNDAMFANSQPATEDIVLDNGSKKRKKWPVVALVTILLAAVCGLVGYFLTNHSGGTDTVAKSFATYKDYLVSGPENLRDKNPEEGTWFVFVLPQINDISDEDIINYTTSLTESYSTFFNTFNKNKTSYPDELINKVNNYSGMLYTVANIASFSAMDTRIRQLAYNEASAEIDSLVSQVAPLPNQREIETDDIAFTFNQYFTTGKSLFENLVKAGCTKNGRIDFECASIDELSTEYAQFAETYEDLYFKISQVSASLQEDFMSETEAISSEVLQND